MHEYRPNLVLAGIPWDALYEARHLCVGYFERLQQLLPPNSHALYDKLFFTTHNHHHLESICGFGLGDFERGRRTSELFGGVFGRWRWRRSLSQDRSHTFQKIGDLDLLFPFCIVTGHAEKVVLFVFDARVRFDNVLDDIETTEFDGVCECSVTVSRSLLVPLSVLGT